MKLNFKKNIVDDYIEYLERLGLDPELLINNNMGNEKIPRLVCCNNNGIKEPIYDKVFGIEVLVARELSAEIRLLDYDVLKNMYYKAFEKNIGPIFCLLIIEDKPPNIKFIFLIPLKDVFEYIKENKIYRPYGMPISFLDDYTIYDLDKQKKFKTEDPDILNEIYKHLGIKEKYRGIS